MLSTMIHVHPISESNTRLAGRSNAIRLPISMTNNRRRGGPPMSKSELEGLPEDLLNRIEKSRQRVIESIGKNMDLYGVTLSVGYLYGNMFFRNSPATLDEMASIMGLSKTSVSTGMRTLQDLKMVQKVWSKGSRKDQYEVEPDWYQTFTDFFSIKWRKSTEMNLLAL